jgi:hypothetical protein
MMSRALVTLAACAMASTVFFAGYSTYSNRRDFQDTYRQLQLQDIVSVERANPTNTYGFFKELGVDISTPEGAAVLLDFQRMNPGKMCGPQAPADVASPLDVPASCMEYGTYQVHDFSAVVRAARREGSGSDLLSPINPANPGSLLSPANPANPASPLNR